MNVVVVGGSGFIGRNIIDLLNKKGFYTISYDVSKENKNANESHLKDVRDYEALENATQNVDYVFNLAATTSPPEFESLDSQGYEVNVMGMYNVLKSAAKNHVKRVVFASSSAVYGSLTQKAREEMNLYNHSNLYPATKIIGEVTSKAFINSFGIDAVFLRYFNTYGTGENSKGAYSSVIHKFIEDLNANKKPTIFGNGKQSRDFIYVKDNARASILAMEKGKNGEAYNIGTGITTDFNKIFEIVREEMGKEIDPDYVKNPFNSYQMFTLADIGKIRKDVGFIPEYDLRRGIKEMINKI